MVREFEEKRRCDVCGNDSVDAYTMSHDGHTVIVDVCETHRKPLARAFACGHDRPVLRTPRERAQAQTHAVIPLSNWKPPS